MLGVAMSMFCLPPLLLATGPESLSLAGKKSLPLSFGGEKSPLPELKTKPPLGDTLGLQFRIPESASDTQKTGTKSYKIVKAIVMTNYFQILVSSEEKK